MTKNIKFDYVDYIHVHLDNTTGEILYNGQISLYSVLMQLYPNFGYLTGGKQMQVIAEATLALAGDPTRLSQLDISAVTGPVTVPPKVFLYECIPNPDGTTWGRIINEESGELLVEVNIDTIAAMEDEFDVEGLRQHLIKMGELLPTDVLKSADC